jgi:hypothetical protein
VCSFRAWADALGASRPSPTPALSRTRSTAIVSGPGGSHSSQTKGLSTWLFAYRHGHSHIHSNICSARTRIYTTSTRGVHSRTLYYITVGNHLCRHRSSQRLTLSSLYHRFAVYNALLPVFFPIKASVQTTGALALAVATYSRINGADKISAQVGYTPATCTQSVGCNGVGRSRRHTRVASIAVDTPHRGADGGVRCNTLKCVHCGAHLICFGPPGGDQY